MDSNKIIEREKDFIERISDKYNYDSNIRHLLYLIIPAFIIKYGIDKKKLILNTFENIKIISSKRIDERVLAYYVSVPVLENNKYITKKNMVIQNYNNISLISLLDNLVHEFNHAVNSYLNEIKETKNYLYIRTGLTNRVYRKDNLTFIKKEDSYILEEIINTKQTNDIINIIKSFDNDNSTIYAINSETENKYNSNSYYLQSYITKEILNNRTFISTLENLRLNGEIEEIENWFDNIIGKDNSYKTFIKELNEIHELEIEYSKKKIFKVFTLNKIKDKSNSIMRMVNKFNNSVNFK